MPPLPRRGSKPQNAAAAPIVSIPETESMSAGETSDEDFIATDADSSATGFSRPASVNTSSMVLIGVGRGNLEEDKSEEPSLSQTSSVQCSWLFDDGTESSKARLNKRDPEWLSFADSVKDSSQNAHTLLATTLVEAGTKCAGLLGKLIYRSFALSEQEGDKELCRKCCACIIRSVLHLTVHYDGDVAAKGIIVDVVNMMFTELRHFRSDVLCSIISSCLDFMKLERDGALPARWIEMFGKIVTVLVGRGDIKQDTDVITGNAYKQHIINEICRLKWTTENTASLVAILREIPGIEEDELKIIFVQMQTCIAKIKAAAFPPIVHQLILLSGNRRLSKLLSICDDYFKKVNFTDSTSLEVKQKRNALGTVVYHFLESARHSDAVVKAIIKVVKASYFDFGKLMSPFMLSVALGLTTYEHAKASIIDPLRTSILKSFYSLHISSTSYWYTQAVGSSEDIVTRCFKAILETKSSELEFMFNGLQELAMGLLNADLYQNKYPNTLDKCRELGSFIIISIIKSSPDQLPVMMKHLLKTSSKSTVHVECLARCMEIRTRQVIQPSIIGRTCEIIRHLPMMESDSAAIIVKALSSAFHLSYILLDQLMINLRKTVWKSVEARRTAAKIMIILLSNSKVVGDVPFSQYSESQRLNDSEGQPSINTANLSDKQPLCLEILTLAKRCFNHQCEIRKELYLGFYSVIRRNPALCELICCHLYNHCNQYLTKSDEDGNSSSTINLSKVVSVSESITHSYGTSVLIKEELGFLVQCLSFVVCISHQAFRKFDESPPAAVSNLEDLLQLWVDSVLAVTPDLIEVIAIQVMGEAGGSRPVDTARYIETALVIQVLQVIEALIEFLNTQNKRGNDKLVKKLFQKLQNLEPLLKKEKEKSTNKKGKGDKNKTKGGDTTKGSKGDITNNNDVTDTTSETSEGQPVLKFKKLEPPKRLIYNHIVNLETIVDMIQKIHKCPSDRGALAAVHAGNEEFEKFLLATVKQKLAKFKRKEPLDERNRSNTKIVQTMADIAGAIWTGLLSNPGDSEAPASLLDPSISNRSEITELRLEVVSEIVTFLCSSHPTICNYLIQLFADYQSESISYDEVFPKFFNSFTTLQAWIRIEPDGEDIVHHHLFDILKAFALPLSTEPAQRYNHSIDVLNWIWKFLSTPPQTCFKAEFNVAESIVSCWFRYYLKRKGSLIQPERSQHDVLTLAKAVHGKLGTMEEILSTNKPQASETKLWIVNDDTASTILCVIMNYIETILNDASSLVTKLKCHLLSDEIPASKTAVIRESCFSIIDQVLTVSSELVVSLFPSGVCASTMLKVIPQIFTVVTGFGEYFLELAKTKQDFSLRGFAVPVSRIGREFKPLVEVMIQHIERVQREHMNEMSTKITRKTKGKVPIAVKNQMVKERRLFSDMVYQIEKYDQLIIALSNKTRDQKGIRLLVGMKLSTARDFKIDGAKFTEAMDGRTKSVQEMTTVADDITEIPADGAAGNAPGTSAARVRKGRKRKQAEAPDEET